MLTLILICAPMSLFIGIAASAIGYTAWSLLMPVLFVFFGFNIYLTLFISLLTDSINAILVTYLFAKQKEIDFPLGFKLIIFSSVIVILGVFIGSTFIPDNTDFFKDNIAYGNLIFVFFFFRRGRKISKLNQQRKNKKNTPTQVDVSPIEEKTKIKPLILYLGIAFVAIQTGVIGIGGGMMYAIALMLIVKYTTSRAIGTAMFITSITALVAAAGIFIQIPQTAFKNDSHLFIIPVILGFSLLGTFIGHGITNRLSEEKINYMVSGVITIACVVAIFQGNAIH